MSEAVEPIPGAAAPGGPLPLNRNQRRVLGVLVEKAFTTPENYPLTANSLVAGCNQKSNRDPVVNLEPDVVDTALLELKELGLVIRVLPATGRTDRWKHALKEKWGLERGERAVLAELLLRGPQSEGELRGRASRMVEIPTLEGLATILEGLAQRGFVLRLSPEGRRRGVIWTHQVCSSAELDRMRAAVPAEVDSDDFVPAAPDATAPTAYVTASPVTSSVASPAASPPAAASPAGQAGAVEGRVSALERQLATLRDRLDQVQARVEDLAGTVQALSQSLRELNDSLGN